MGRAVDGVDGGEDGGTGLHEMKPRLTQTVSRVGRDNFGSV